MAKKFNQKLLNEELKKFKMLSEYSFYTEEPKKDNLILGTELEEADETPAETEPADDSKTAANQTGDAAATDAPADDQNMFGTDAGGETTDDTASTDDTTGDTETGAEEPADTGAEDMTQPEGEDEVEVDVTQIVKGSEEAKKSADLSLVKTSELLDKFNDLEQKVASMDTITSKIDALEKELVKRNPTPVEKLEMRSMHSFPYNIKLNDYWKDVEGYDVDDTKSKEPKEFVLTKDDVDSEYLDTSIKKSFDIPDDYEEEDIYA